jgi:cysteinyl-tRNA synthetase
LDLADNSTLVESDFQSLARIVFAFGLNLHAEKKTLAPQDMTDLAEKRWAAKQAKDFAAADVLRKELTAAGWAMLDGKDGYKLEPLKK